MWHRINCFSMSATVFQSVDEYLQAQPEAVRGLLQSVRKAIRKAVPEAVESISYKMPAYKLQGSALLYFAAWKEHYSLYPVGPKLVAAFQDELEPYAVSKATVRFPLTRPVPAGLIERIAKFRAGEIAARPKAPKA